MALPAVIGGLVTWSWQGALSALFWASLVRIALLHHTTWSINSVCHVYGERPFDSRDKATNFWPLAILSFGENWHNLHHADPTCARHGVLRGQIDMNARLIWIFEKFGWVSNVRWPKLDRLQGKMRRAGEDGAGSGVRSTSLTSYHGNGDRVHARDRRRPTRREVRGRRCPYPRSPNDGRAALRRRPARRAHHGKVRMSSAQRREQLIAVGRHIFAEKGLDATSVEEVAARAKVSKPVVYEHFGGKEGLYAVVVDREVRSLLDRITTALTAGHPRELLEQAALALLDYIEEETDGFRVLVRESPVGSSTGNFSSVLNDVAHQVEHILARSSRPGGTTRSSPNSTHRRSSAWSR